jgi:hypothetical protein
MADSMVAHTASRSRKGRENELSLFRFRPSAAV